MFTADLRQQVQGPSGLRIGEKRLKMILKSSENKNNSFNVLIIDNNFNLDLNQVREEARLPAVSSAVLYEIFPFIMVTIIITITIILIIILIIIILVIIMVTIINSTSSSPFSSARCHYHDLLQISASQTCTSSQVFGEDMVIQSIGRSLTQILPNLPGQVPTSS